jgi:hypothetical protein
MSSRIAAKYRAEARRPRRIYFFRPNAVTRDGSGARCGRARVTSASIAATSDGWKRERDKEDLRTEAVPGNCRSCEPSRLHHIDLKIS